MFKRLSKAAGTLAFFSLFSVFLTSCKEDNNNPDPEPEPQEKQYMVWVLAGNPAGPYILPTKTLAQGKVSPVGAGVDMTAYGTSAPGAIVDKDGFIYFLLNSRFTKAKIENNQLVPESAIVINGHTLIGSFGHHFWDGGRLIIMENGAGANAQPIFTIIDTKKMEIVSSGTLPLPGWSTDKVKNEAGKEIDATISLNVAHFREGKLFVAWKYNKETGDLQTHYGSLAYPAMNSLSNANTTDFPLWGAYSPSLIKDVSVTDNEGNYYMRTYANVNGTARYNGYVRIKKGETEIDPNYAFELDKSLFTYHSCDLGNGLVLLSLYNSKNTGPLNYRVENKIIDLKQGKVVADLNQLGLPISSWSPKAAIYDGGKAYLVTSTETQGSFIWEYDPVANKLTKGLEIERGVTNISYITRLK